MKYSILIFLVIACSTAPAQQIQKINNEELVELLKDPNVQLVDVRTPEEVSEGIINGANHINFFDADFETQIGKLDKTKPIAIYCRSGSRSGQAVAKLTNLGFKKTYDISGGFNGWQAGGYPIINP